MSNLNFKIYFSNQYLVFSYLLFSIIYPAQRFNFHIGNYHTEHNRHHQEHNQQAVTQTYHIHQTVNNYYGGDAAAPDAPAPKAAAKQANQTISDSRKRRNKQKEKKKMGPAALKNEPASES